MTRILHRHLFLTLLSIFLLLNISACKDDRFGEKQEQWQEEVPLSNGSVIWVDLTAKYEVSGTAWGGGGAIDNLWTTIQVPASAPFALRHYGSLKILFLFFWIMMKKSKYGLLSVLL